MAYVMPINREPLIPFGIGIDPDVDKSGYSIWSRRSKTLKSCDDFKFCDLLREFNKVVVGKAEFYVEAGYLNKGYHHYDSLPKGFETRSLKSQWAYMVKCGMEVGRNFQMSYIIIEYLRDMGHTVHEVKPVTAKWDRHDLARYAGWTEPTNQDKRDSAKLAMNGEVIARPIRTVKLN